MPAESHAIMDGKVHVYRRENSRRWQCAVYLERKKPPGDDGLTTIWPSPSLSRSDWYLERCADDRLLKRGIALPAPNERLAAGVARSPETRQARPAEDREDRRTPRSTRRRRLPTASTRSSPRASGTRSMSPRRNGQLRLYLRPFFGKDPVGEVTAGLVQAYRAKRLSGPIELSRRRTRRSCAGRRPKIIGRSSRPAAPQAAAGNGRRAPPCTKRSSSLRQVLKYREPPGLDRRPFPDLSAPYKSSGKIGRRAWFSPEEYKRLYTATRERAKQPAERAVARGVREVPRLRAVHGQHRPAAGRGVAHRIPRRDHRPRRGHRRAHPGDRGPRQARGWLLQEHAGRGAAVPDGCGSAAAARRANWFSARCSASCSTPSWTSWT